MIAVEVKNLKKCYDKKVAVDGANFTIEDGKIIGFLGPNGAGKSTTLNTILGLVKKTEGSIKIFGMDAEKNRAEINRNIGYVPQDLAIYMDLSAYKNVEFFGKLYGLKGQALAKAVEEALTFTGLYERRKDPARSFSGGMQRRLNIACAIVSKPKLLIMDEPTVGVDPQSRNSILEAIRKLNEDGATIIYTSHYMEEVEAICEKIYIMDSGCIIAEGTCKEIIEKAMEGNEIVVETSKDPRIVMEKIEKLDGVKSVDVQENELRIKYTDNDKVAANIFDMVYGAGLSLVSVEKREFDLEDAFLSLTGKSLRD